MDKEEQLEEVIDTLEEMIIEIEDLKPNINGLINVQRINIVQHELNSIRDSYNEVLNNM